MIYSCFQMLKNVVKKSQNKIIIVLELKHQVIKLLARSVADQVVKVVDRLLIVVHQDVLMVGAEENFKDLIYKNMIYIMIRVPKMLGTLNIFEV